MSTFNPALAAARRGNSPVWSFATIVVLVVALVIVYLAGVDGRAALFIGFVITTLPSLVASLNAERAARDIRNGVVEEKARAGAAAALDQAGVMTRTGPVATAQLAALTALLQQVHATTSETSSKVDGLQETAVQVATDLAASPPPVVVVQQPPPADVP